LILSDPDVGGVYPFGGGLSMMNEVMLTAVGSRPRISSA
jgi:hypothetical protein